MSDKRAWPLVDAALASAGAASLSTGVVSMTVIAVQDSPISPGEWGYAALNFLIFATYIAIGSFLVFLTGVGFLGPPTYLVLKKLGFMTDMTAVLAGGILAGGVAWIIQLADAE